MPPVFRYTLSRFFCFMQEKRFFHFPLRRGWADRVARPVFHEDGTVEMREMLDLGLTIDERLADGYYYSKTIRLLKKLLENPELLETPAAQEIEY